MKAGRSVTTHDFAKLCERLAEKFNNHYSSEEYRFDPERITEGGIVFSNYEGYPGPYKAIRLFARRKEGTGFANSLIRWPWIDTDQLSEWTQAEAKELYPEGARIDTFLKAFRGAQEWTKCELELFETCFKEVGFTRVSAYPKLNQ